MDKNLNPRDGKTEDSLNTFKKRMLDYKQEIDADITKYIKQVKKTTNERYGKKSYLVSGALSDILERGGKRIRGSLVMAGYEMSGGKNYQMILQAARAIEILHAYILVIDDIQDRSGIRRNGPTAHVMLADYHKQHHFAGNSDHFGVAMAVNAALMWEHMAQDILANLDADPILIIKAISIVNENLTTTIHGQTADIMNEIVGEVSERDVYQMMGWKTAKYTILNPLQVGMILAGANDKKIDSITDYAIYTGIAFQITDDITGVFGSEKDNGKSPMDDIREGKRTLMMVYALNHANPTDNKFLIKTLGNRKLTKSDFLHSKQILTTCGAKKYAEQEAEKHVKTALKSLDKNAKYWKDDDIEFLKNLAIFIITRNS